ncbi:Translation initiation factor 2 [Mesoplasma florum W37]|uniref:Translation initiation factor IF-2 n=1 Tax=Mesoplasma florum TaxID=2151 RepID=A0A2R3NXK3_MESFO|nr:translation initiation factor IF-2 [Mesoplasma florum]AGY41375.1 Translation initiation factor 2 [Mesoplasma florum W37]ATI73939.1 translation initiation factor IF-2 [Mesoplasma florum]AVN58912.1 translation initiation factor IF-2 [Mesoplasma florum]AVN59598.1 translation initiation factor IF-2 [Mesoplasma florum]AVN65035.1 translation initiation factor IF-2 [Mesoplasma florum]
MAKNIKTNKKPQQVNKKEMSKQHAKQIKQQLNETVATGIIDGVFVYTEALSIADFANQIGKSVAEILKYFFAQGLMLNQNVVLSEEQMAELALEFGFDFRKEESLTKENFFEALDASEEDKPEDLEHRAPIVTIMGHVDHGKTTLLDSIKNTNVVGGEAGGITQAIGAYQVKNKDGKKITFIDTPGHEAFSEMRSRGANVTDIVILIVAADDGVMPQTEEAIDHAKLANVPIIVFINKCDKPGADPERVKAELMKYEIVAEEYGGDIPFVQGSAKQKIGLDQLEETILLIAEMQDYKANPNKLAKGVVIEAHLDKAKGPVASILVKEGTLDIRDMIIAGTTYGNIKHMEDEHNKKVLKAGPSKPVVVYGLNEVPSAGDKFIVMNDEKMARTIAEAQAEKKLAAERQSNQIFSLDSIKKHIDDGELKAINLIVKADTQGSVEALKGSLTKIDIPGVKLNIIRASVGTITLSDVTLASTVTDGIVLIYGFNVRPDAVVRKKAEEEGIEIRLHNIIYKVIEELEDAAKGMLDPEYKEVVTGSAEIRATFKHSDIGTIGGFHITDGSIERKSKVRIIRNGIVIYTGELATLKHLKDDIKEAKINSEGGLTIKNFNDIKEGDIVEGYKEEEVKK